MTAPRREPLAKERIEELIAWCEKHPKFFDGMLDMWLALRELLEARERIEKQDDEIAALRKYVDYFDRASRGAVLMANAHGYRFPMDLYDEGVSLRKRIGRNEDGTWCEPKAKDAKEWNDAL